MIKQIENRASTRAAVKKIITIDSHDREWSAFRYKMTAAIGEEINTSSWYTIQTGILQQAALYGNLVRTKQNEYSV